MISQSQNECAQELHFPQLLFSTIVSHSTQRPDAVKSTQRGSKDGGVKYGAACMQGWSATMQDVVTVHDAIPGHDTW